MLNNSNAENANKKKYIYKDISVAIDVDRARKMLMVAGFEVESLSDDEIANLAIEQLKRFGVSVLPF